MPIRRQLKKVKNLLFTFFYDMYNSERFRVPCFSAHSSPDVFCISAFRVSGAAPKQPELSVSLFQRPSAAGTQLYFRLRCLHFSAQLLKNMIIHFTVRQCPMGAFCRNSIINGKIGKLVVRKPRQVLSGYSQSIYVIISDSFSPKARGISFPAGTVWL